jgi:hypothetical protein
MVVAVSCGWPGALGDVPLSINNAQPPVEAVRGVWTPWQLPVPVRGEVLVLVDVNNHPPPEPGELNRVPAASCMYHDDKIICSEP